MTTSLHTISAATLPVPLTGFVGRGPELAEVTRRLDDARLLTLTGAGGSGKTRLALAVATAAATAHGWSLGWVELAGLTEPALIAQHVGEQLGVREERSEAATQALRERLGARPTLLVLDNCEHLVDAAARLVDALLRACPALRVLATSREPLGIAGERAWLVPPLALPPVAAALAPEAALGFDAIRLFVARAGDVAPGFALTADAVDVVAEICRRLDGLPLAIELAAARVRVLTLPQLRDRLDDRFRLLTGGARTAIPRHQTLRATIDWSYALLTIDEQRLLDRLSVFRGGCTLEAAEAVCADDPDQALALLDTLARLVDRSLVGMHEVDGGARYALLETVRQYAAERLEASGDAAAVHARHAAQVAALVAAAEPHLITAARPAWLARLHAELDNIRHALAWTRAADPELHLRLTGRLCWFWFSTGYWSEGRRWAEDALALPAAAAPTPARAATAFAAAVIATLQAQPTRAEAWLAEALAIATAHGDARLVAYANAYLGMALIQQRRADGEAPSLAATAWFRAHDDRYGLRLALLMLGSLYTAQADFARAVPVLEEAVAVARGFGLARERGIAIQMLGWVTLRQGELARAGALVLESLEALREDPMHLFLARGLELIGLVAEGRGAGAAAVQLLAAGAAVREAIGAGMFETDRMVVGPRLDALAAALGEPAFAAAWAAGKQLEFDAALAAARAEVARAAPDAGGAAGGAVAMGAAPDAGVAAAVAAPRLIVRALGPLTITCDGVTLGKDAWPSARAKELLLYLLCQPHGRTRAEVGLEFWPDASAAQVKNSFHVLLHRLRKAIGRADVVVIDDDRYAINPALAPWFDVVEFERALRAARRDPARLAAALAHYGGEFLRGEAVGDWHVAIQDRLRVRFLDGLALLAEVQLAAGAIADATAALERLIEAEPLREAAHRELMRCYARAGQRERALALHERLVVGLRRELAAAPERATAELARQLRRAEPV